MHPLALRLQRCDSPPSIISVLQEQVNSDERLTKWLNPTVNVIYALSSNVGEDVGLVMIGVYPFSAVALLTLFRYYRLRGSSLLPLALCSR
jgi:hypothetical protein